MGTVEKRTGRIGLGDLGIRWYHIGFAFSFGIGTAIFPPSGVGTIAGWIGGALGSLVTSLVLSGAILFAVRSFDEWRPPSEPQQDRPDTRLVTVLFGLLCLQLFIFGTQISVDLGPAAIVLLLAPFNLLVAAVLLGDMHSLRKQGIEWETADYAYPVIALVVGFVGGLGYWYRRGRRRAAWDAGTSEQETTAADTDTAESDAADEE